ncbi:MAG: hypothetical protein A2W99_10790 [Bacteroidetes bacterium GWF2_33_16]|nr:MAG: hypothetical protein A2X00_04950 [Bacteroidetes bacterium GWE2_32_14]OFY04025.1 MAG: hypothetical protein A2W99_10790 [Bacteroidetes bacterium GWF2_33_16]
MIKQFFSGLRHIFFISSVFLIIGASCNKKQEVNKEYEIKSITETINSVIGWAINKDFDRFFNSIANDSDFISVTPYKRVKFGFEEVKRDTAFWANPKFKAISHELKDLKIQLSNSGNTAWFYCILNDINEWDGQPANWENVAWTGVLEKRNGKWVVVMQHYSFAATK